MLSRRNLADVHRSNVTCVRLVPGSDRVLTGAGDGFVRCIGFDGTVHWQVCTAACLYKQSLFIPSRRASICAHRVATVPALSVA